MTPTAPGRENPASTEPGAVHTDDTDYDDLGGDYFTRRNTDRQRDRLIQQLTKLGYYVTLDKIA